MKRVALFGGTFDPPHFGHLHIAREVQKQLQFDEVRWIPTHRPPHKQVHPASSADRLMMLQLLLAEEGCFTIDSIELERPGPSYTIDTIRALQDLEPETHFSFLIGADMIDYLPNWMEIDELLQRMNFIGVARSGYNGRTVYPIQIVEVSNCDISSSLIREKVQLEQSIEAYVPATIAAYIEEHGLYGNKASD